MSPQYATSIDSKPPDLVPGRRQVPLDVLRAGAIFLVLVGHVTFRMPDNTLGARFFFILRQTGLIGVDMFLVLSGFFTAVYLFGEHQESGEISFKRFFARRAFKLYPTYLLAVFIAFAWQAMHMHRGALAERAAAAFEDTWQYFAHVQNYSEAKAEPFVQTWTLVLIIQFYLAFSLLLLVLGKLGGGKAVNPFRAIPWIFLATLVGCFLLRYRAANVVPEYYPWVHNFPTHLRLDELMAGVLLAYLVVYERPRLENIARFWPLILLVSLGVMLPVALRKAELPRFLYIWGFSLSGMGCAGLVLLAWLAGRADPVTGRPVASWAAALPLRIIAALGVCSYSIYIWHLPLGAWLGTRVGNRMCSAFHLWGSPIQYAVLLAIYLAVAIGISVVMYFLIERPGLLLGQWALRRRSDERLNLNHAPPTFGAVLKA